MRHARWQQQHFALSNLNILAATIVDHLQQHITLDLVKKLGSLVDVIVAPRVRAANDHDDEVILVEDLPIAHWRFELIAMPVDPADEIEGRQ